MRFADDDWEEEFANQGLMWEANRTRHLRGRKGQAVLRELQAALLELPEKRLIAGRLGPNVVSDSAMQPDAVVLWIGRRPGTAPEPPK